MTARVEREKVTILKNGKPLARNARVMILYGKFHLLFVGSGSDFSLQPGEHATLKSLPWMVTRCTLPLSTRGKESIQDLLTKRRW